MYAVRYIGQRLFAEVKRESALVENSLAIPFRHLRAASLVHKDVERDKKQRT